MLYDMIIPSLVTNLSPTSSDINSWKRVMSTTSTSPVILTVSFPKTFTLIESTTPTRSIGIASI